MREKQKKIIQWSSRALILLTGIIVWRVNYEIDFMMDDEWYSTLLYADTPIRNLGDIVHAQIWHYFNWGGRSMAHALLQMILLTGESWADILNTDVYTGVADLPGCRQSPYALLFCGTGNAVWTECQLENEHVLGSGCSELSVHDRIYPGVSALLSEI